MKRTIPLHFFLFIRSFDFIHVIQEQQAAAVVPGITECCCSTYTTSRACGDPAHCRIFWVDHGDAAARSLPVRRKYRSRRTFVAEIFYHAPLVREYNERFGIHVNTQMDFIFPYILDAYNVFHLHSFITSYHKDESFWQSLSTKHRTKYLTHQTGNYPVTCFVSRPSGITLVKFHSLQVTIKTNFLAELKHQAPN